MYHIQHPVPMSLANGTNQEMHWELRLHNYSIDGWPDNTTDRVFITISYPSPSNATTNDAFWCSVNPTGNATRDVIQCYDGYLKDPTNKTSVTPDTIDNLMMKKDKSFTNYSTAVSNTSKLLNMTAHFTTYF